MKKYFKFFASILLILCFADISCAQTKIDWKQIKNIPDTLEFNNVLLEHLLFKSAYQPVMDTAHKGAIYYDNQTERLRVYENGQWRDLSVSIASDSIGAPLTILGYLQASDIYASQSAYIGKDVDVKGNVNASGTSTFNYLKVNNALKVPTVASAALGVGSVYYDTSVNKLKVLNSSNQWKVISVDVDSALSTTSTNPVQNKVIAAKINQTDADLINGMAATLQQSYNYANGIATQAYNYADGIATQAYNYADSVASDAQTASENYANTQIGILRSYVSQQLGSGTSDLYVKSLRVSEALKVPVFVESSYLGVGSICYDNIVNKLRVLDEDGEWYDVNKSILIKTGSSNGTITVEEDDGATFNTYEVAVKGLGSAAYTNVASITESIGGSDVASKTEDFFSSAPLCVFSNPHIKGSNAVWDTSDTGNSCSFAFYKISDDYKTIRVSLSFGYTQGSPFTQGTYGAMIAQSYYVYDIQPFIDGLEIETITAYSRYGMVDVVNGRIVKGINDSQVVNPFCVVCDLKSTQLGADEVIINIVFRKLKN